MNIEDDEKINSHDQFYEDVRMIQLKKLIEYRTQIITQTQKYLIDDEQFKQDIEKLFSYIIFCIQNINKEIGGAIKIDPRTSIFGNNLFFKQIQKKNLEDVDFKTIEESYDNFVKQIKLYKKSNKNPYYICEELIKIKPYARIYQDKNTEEVMLMDFFGTNISIGKPNELHCKLLLNVLQFHNSSQNVEKLYEMLATKRSPRKININTNSAIISKHKLAIKDNISDLNRTFKNKYGIEKMLSYKSPKEDRSGYREIFISFNLKNLT